MLATLTTLAALLAAPAADGRTHREEPVLTVHWEDRALRDVARDLGGFLGVPFLLSRELRDRAEETLTLDLEHVKASALLGVVREQLDVRYVAGDGLVWITTPADAVRRTAVLHVYDVRVLTTRPMPIPPPPEMGIRGQRIEEEVEVEEPPPRVDEDALLELLQNGTGGDETWSYKGTSIRLVSGRLFVRHTPEVHRKVLQILAGLGGI